MVRPKKSFFQLIAEHGMPNRFRRHCCSNLKEYKILDKCVMGVRKSESINRNKRYNEPTQCRFYGSKKEHVEAIYPILDWEDQDVVDFVNDRHIKLHPLYYREDGTVDPTRRLGCMTCPLKYWRKRIDDFKAHPNMVKAYIHACDKYRENHKHVLVSVLYNDSYEWFVRNFFFEKQSDWDNYIKGMFGRPDCKKFLEEYFNIEF